MQITVNGTPERLDAPLSVAEYLKLHAPNGRGSAAAACAVEVNRKLVPKARHAECVLNDGDVVEIVTLVGGG